MATAVEYIGHRATYREGAYGSGLVFTQGETKVLEDDELAKKLLRHPDVYVPGKTDSEGIAAVPVADKKDSKADDEDQTQDQRDSVMAMTKGALAQFAKTNFNVDIDQKKKVGDLRLEVVRMIDQFGAS